MSRLLPEWLNSNYNKAYPLDASTAVVTGTLPSDFLLDMLLITGGPVNVNNTYISAVQNDGRAVRLYLSTQTGGIITTIGLLAEIPLNTAPNTEIPIELKNAEAGILLNGYLVVGHADISRSFPEAVTSVAPEAGKLYPGIIIPVTNWTAGLIVDDTLISGDVRIIAGAGIAIRATTLEVNGVTQPVIYLECTDSFSSSEEGSINSDQELADYIYSTYGRPVYSLNGVYPDDTGNIQIDIVEADAEEGASPSITITPSGTGALVINDNRTKPCCTTDDQQLVIDNIAAVNDRVSRVSSTITAVETNLNGLSAQQALIGS